MKNTLKAIFIAVLLSPAIISAATLSVGETVSYKNQEVRDNLYLAGGNVTVSSVVFGDLIAVGGSVTVSGNVSDDIAIGGGNVSILGEAGGDVRVTGGNVIISRSVGGDLLIAGGTANILSGVTVKKDLLGAVGAGNFDGNVDGNVRISGGDITINGRISGDASINTAEKLTFGPEAKIGGSLVYSAPEEIEIPEGVVAGSIEYTPSKAAPTKDMRGKILALLGAFFIIKLIVVLVSALLLVFVVPSITKTVIGRGIKTPGRELLRGFLMSVGIPIGSIIALVSIVGSIFGIAALLLFAVLMIISSVLGGVLFGTLLAQIFFKSEDVANWKHALWGVVVLQIVGLVPVVGWIVKFGMVMIMLGALGITLFDKFFREEA